MASPSSDDLAEIGLFRDLTAEARATVAAVLTVEEVPPGRRLTRQGAHGYAFVVLRSGAAQVAVDGAVVRTLGPGDYFGEVSLLLSDRQTATVTTTSACTVWRMFGASFRQFQLAHPDVARVLEATALERAAFAPPQRKATDAELAVQPDAATGG